MGTPGKCPAKKWLINRHILDRHNALLAREINHAVDQQKRVTMRQYAQNIVNIELDVLGLRRVRDWTQRVCHSRGVADDYNALRIRVRSKEKQ